MSDVAPIMFSWTGDSFTPVNTHAQKQADKFYVIGERYAMAPVFERSPESHRHFFALVREAWLNLRPEEAERHPTEKHLRKYALIKTGFCDRQEFLASSKAEAVRIAAFLKGVDDYAVVIVRGNVVERLTAKSQSYRSMKKDEFQRSKEAVLGYISILIGVTPKQLASASAV